MIEAFRDGRDIHTLTAALVNHVEPEKVTPEMRRAAKTINFGILYGMGAVSLAENIGVSRKEADTFIREYFAQFPSLKTYLESLKEKARRDGYVETLFGRRRYFKDVEGMGWQARREAERMAINAPIQGTGADIIKIAMVRIYEELETFISNDTARLILQVHDELLFEIKKNLVSAISSKIQTIMEGVTALKAPLKVDTKHGPNWLSMAK